MMPKVSVVLPVYNGAPYLRESINSILAQSFPDFELLVLNDGSSDDSSTIVLAYVDSRIRFIEHPNMGLAATLNKGVSLAKGEFIVRQDQDDVSLPTRIARQVEYLERHPEVAVLGTWATIVNAEGKPEGRMHRHPVGHTALRIETLFDSAFVHSSITIRRDALLAAGGYTTDRTRQPPEDYELWSRLLRAHWAANIPEPLLLYREVASSMSRTMKTDFCNRVTRISAENLLYWSGSADAGAEKVALFAARLIHAANVPHDHSVSLAAVRSLFDAACEGIARAEGGLDKDAKERYAYLRFSLVRAWSVGGCRTEWGRWLARAAWKFARSVR